MGRGRTEVNVAGSGWRGSLVGGAPRGQPVMLQALDTADLYPPSAGHRTLAAQPGKTEGQAICRLNQVTCYPECLAGQLSKSCYPSFVVSNLTCCQGEAYHPDGTALELWSGTPPNFGHDSLLQDCWSSKTGLGKFRHLLTGNSVCSPWGPFSAHRSSRF